jgi:hypothetical protein
LANKKVINLRFIYIKKIEELAKLFLMVKSPAAVIAQSKGAS